MLPLTRLTRYIHNIHLIWPDYSQKSINNITYNSSIVKNLLQTVSFSIYYGPYKKDIYIYRGISISISYEILNVYTTITIEHKNNKCYLTVKEIITIDPDNHMVKNFTMFNKQLIELSFDLFYSVKKIFDYFNRYKSS